MHFIGFELARMRISKIGIAKSHHPGRNNKLQVRAFKRSHFSMCDQKGNGHHASVSF
jgi:hypothetical protein